VNISFDAFQKYLNSSIFKTPENFDSDYIYNRPHGIRNTNISDEDFFRFSILSDNLLSNDSLVSNRLLMSIYEQNMLLLNEEKLSQNMQNQFFDFYDVQHIAMGRFLKPKLEHKCFSFLDDFIKISNGNWDSELLTSYFEEQIEQHESVPSNLCQYLEKEKNPDQAKFVLIQMAPDFLTEASAMCKALPGSFGTVQSEFMKIFIDEYGYGVHSQKHSSLFEKCLESVNISSRMHKYYHFYLASSLMLVNYFHYVCENKRNWFRYLGALYYTEATIPHFNKQMSKVLKHIFGSGSVDTKYFDEHVHIDVFHKNMVLNNLILPSVETYGTSIIPDIIKGFEEFKFLQDVSDKDVLEQLKFSINSYPKNISEVCLRENPDVFKEKKMEISFPHLHQNDELFYVKCGNIKFFNGVNECVLKENDVLFIPKNRLHGTIAMSDDCEYFVSKEDSI